MDSSEPLGPMRPSGSHFGGFRQRVYAAATGLSPRAFRAQLHGGE
jgi:hypothetical protein